MLVGIHQLHYLPWLRYFEKIARSDVFVALDDIQYSKNGWQNRNKVKTSAGATLLTVPIFERLGQRLDEVRIDNSLPWRRKHWRTIEQAYHKAPHFADYASFLEETYARDWEMLNDLNFHMLEGFLAALLIDTPVARSSHLRVPGKATERLIELIEAVDGDCYYSGAYALDAYLDANQLASAGIGLELQEWRAPVYPQLYGEFLPDLSILDLLMNCGSDSLPILLGEST